MGDISAEDRREIGELAAAADYAYRLSDEAFERGAWKEFAERRETERRAENAFRDRVRGALGF